MEDDMDRITMPFDKETLVPELEARFNKLKAINKELLASHDRLLAAVVDWHSPYDGWSDTELIKRYDVVTRRRIHRSRDAIEQARKVKTP
jgi:hypothetical protein